MMSHVDVSEQTKTAKESRLSVNADLEDPMMAMELQ